MDHMLISVASVVALLVLGVALLVAGKSYWAWVLPGAGALGLEGYHLSLSGNATNPIFLAVAAVFAAVAIVFGFKPVRIALLSAPLMRVMAGILPKMGDTEREALEAGTVWWDGELFSGKPDWKKLIDFQVKPLSQEERAFLEGPVEELCGMLNEWETEKARDLTPEVWDFIRRKGFFGIIIPKEYGGLGFGAAANSAIVAKVASRHGTAAVTVMVPNSLGPAELLLHYGTDEQKNHYLPRLANGTDVPCFALTGPEAGSDAGSTRSEGIVCKGMWEGKEVLGMRLTWNKRYITLAPIATVLGLAFRLKDPDHLLGDKDDVGITVALIPTSVPGVEIGLRHDALYNNFLVGPTFGKDIFVPLEFIIGGPKMAGCGWRMLMQCLAAGRGISLPAVAAAAGQMCCRGVGAYATVREQFDMPIGKFEGIEEPLARIAGYTYVIDAARKLTTGAIDSGAKPAVVSAIVKRYLSELQRVIVNDAMDVVAGAAICRGPRNIIARGYVSTPISITVEGANILTRTLIIFGQGAIRCHPFVQGEMRSVAEKNVPAFDRAFWGHIGLIFSNMARSFVFGINDGAWARPGNSHPVLDKYMGRLTRMSSAFVLAADIAMGTLGANLKRAEKLSGRFADALAWMYLASATMKRFHDEGRREQDLPFVQWGLDNAMYEIQDALSGIIDNLPNRPAAGLLKLLVFPLGRTYRKPSDRLGSKVARALLEDRDERLILSKDIYSAPESEPGLGYLEFALDKVMQAQPILKKVKDAVRARTLAKLPEADLYDRALAAAVITDDERRKIREAEEARWEAIQVDNFSPQEMGEWKHGGKATGRETANV